MTVKKKVCKACGEAKDVTEFHGARPKRERKERDWGFPKLESTNRRVATRCVSCVVRAKLAKMEDPNYYLNEPENYRWRNYYQEKGLEYDLADQRKHEAWVALNKGAQREENRERARRYAEANPEKVKERAKKYREANPEASKEAARKYYLANKERILAKRREAYAAKKGLDLL